MSVQTSFDISETLGLGGSLQQPSNSAEYLCNLAILNTAHDLLESYKECNLPCQHRSSSSFLNPVIAEIIFRNLPKHFLVKLRFPLAFSFMSSDSF